MLNDELLHKWVNGTLNAEELERFRLRPEYDSLVDLYKNTENISAPGFDQEVMLTEILKEKKGEVPKVDLAKRRSLSNWMKYAAAASVLLLATWFFWPKKGLVTYDLAKGERKEGVLPDQSMFTLNAESTLTYDAASWDKIRSLNLKGEAFFSVKPGSKFKVNTPDGAVQVLGTKFNVWSRKGILEVKCETGKVAVLSSDGKVIDELNPNDAIRIVDNKATEKWQISANEQNWVKGVSSFKKVKLQVVLEALERQFDIKINSGTINTEEVISCNIPHQDLELALKTCLSPVNLKYEIRNGNEVILSKE